MKKLFLVSVSVLCLLLFSAPAKAGTITIDFDTYGFAAAAAQGISFENAQVIEDQYGVYGNKLGAISYEAPIIIWVDSPLLSFSCAKWEPYDEEGSGTVYWDFFNSNNIHVGHFEDSNKGSWIQIQDQLFDSSALVQKIIISAHIKDNGPYFLDNLKFSLGTPNNPVPEPSSLLFFVLGLMGLAGIRKNKL